MTDPKDDILKGVKAIAGFIGESERRTGYLIDRGLLPVGRMGKILLASKTKLREHYARIANGEAA